jgi:hypothetical protein
MFVVLLLMHPFKALFGDSSASRATYWSTYFVMLAVSALLGYAVQRWFSEPINQALRLRFRTVPPPRGLDMSRKPMA